MTLSKKKNIYIYFLNLVFERKNFFVAFTLRIILAKASKLTGFSKRAFPSACCFLGVLVGFCEFHANLIEQGCRFLLEFFANAFSIFWCCSLIAYFALALLYLRSSVACSI